MYVHPDIEPTNIKTTDHGGFSLYEFENGYSVEIEEYGERRTVIPAKRINVDGKLVRIASSGEFEYLGPNVTDDDLTAYITNIGEHMVESSIEDLVKELTDEL
jgi:hypothetical protein